MIPNIVHGQFATISTATGVISSATVEQITEVTDYLKSKTKLLHPFPFKVLNDQK